MRDFGVGKPPVGAVFIDFGFGFGHLGAEFALLLLQLARVQRHQEAAGFDQIASGGINLIDPAIKLGADEPSRVGVELGAGLDAVVPGSQQHVQQRQHGDGRQRFGRGVFWAKNTLGQATQVVF